MAWIKDGQGGVHLGCPGCPGWAAARRCREEWGGEEPWADDEAEGVVEGLAYPALMI